MTHRTFRSLDQPPKLLGFTATQWCWLIGDLAAVLALVLATGMPAKAAITLLAFTVGLPATLAYVSETGGIQPGRLLADAVRWRLAPRQLAAGRSGARRGRDSLEETLGVLAIEPDGLLIRADGTVVRYLEVTPVNPLAMEPAETERVCAGFAQAVARLAAGQSLQLYVHASPLRLEELLAVQAHRCEQAAGAAESDGHAERARALRALGVAHERTIRTIAQTGSPPAIRYLVACPYRRGCARAAASRPAGARDACAGARGVRSPPRRGA